MTAYSFIFAKSKFASVIIDGVLGPLCLGRHKWHCPCISGSNARCERGLLKGAMSAQKAFQGSEMETRELLGGTAEHSFSRPGVINLLSREICDF